MSKIDEFEQHLIRHGMTDNDLAEYAKLLKRVRGSFLKRQHCYATAIKFPKNNADQAIALIEYGLNSFEDGWFSTYTSYLYMGWIYEKTDNYKKAYESYLLAKGALGPNNPANLREISGELMWMKLHIDNFAYSAELEDYYSCFVNTDNFSKSFINSEFKLAVAGIVVSLHHGKTGEAKELLDKAKSICRPDYLGKLSDILARNKYTETLKTTPEVMKFIKSVKL